MRLLNRVLSGRVAVDLNIGGAYVLDALSVEVEQFDCHPSDIRQRQDRQAIARPDEMLRPLVLARVEERNRLPRRLVEDSLLV